MFICLMGDVEANAMTPQVPLNVATAIGLVAHHTTRRVLGAATAFDRTPRHECFKPYGFVTLTRGQHARHQLFLACRAQMDVGAPAALASTKASASAPWREPAAC